MVAPKGPFGGSGGPEDGWIGDQGKSVQVQAFEAGTDYLFFQGPAPKTAVQEDLPSFFSLDNFAELEFSLAQLLVTATGIGSFAVALSIVTGGTIDLPSTPAPAATSAPAPKALKATTAAAPEKEKPDAAAKAKAAEEKAAAKAAEKAEKAAAKAAALQAKKDAIKQEDAERAAARAEKVAAAKAKAEAAKAAASQ